MTMALAKKMGKVLHYFPSNSYGKYELCYLYTPFLGYMGSIPHPIIDRRMLARYPKKAVYR